MNFDLGDTEKALQEKVRALFSDTCAEPLKGWGEESVSALRRESLTWLNRLAHAGYLGLEDKPYGPAAVAAQQLLAALSPALYVCAETSARIFGRLMNAYGSPQLRSQVLPAIRHGEAMGTVALSEPGFHETRADMGTVGSTTSEGFRVSGEKPQVMNAPIADWIAVAGTVDNSDAAAFFLVSRHDQGLFMGRKSPPPRL